RIIKLKTTLLFISNKFDCRLSNSHFLWQSFPSPCLLWWFAFFLLLIRWIPKEKYCFTHIRIHWFSLSACYFFSNSFHAVFIFSFEFIFRRSRRWITLGPKISFEFIFFFVRFKFLERISFFFSNQYFYSFIHPFIVLIGECY